MAGPYIEAALFCERMIEHADGNISLIGVSNKVAASEAEAPSGEPERFIDTVLFLSVRAGDVTGRHILRVRPSGPNGDDDFETAELPIALEGGLSGAQVQLSFALPVSKPGTYWFDVLFGEEGEPLTRTPLQVEFE